MADAEDRSFQPESGDLGEGVPANVDLTKLGQRDNPQEDWGEAADAEAQHGGNHLRAERDRGQGAKTRKANRDIFSRRA